LTPASTTSPTKNVCVPKSCDERSAQSTQAIASAKIGAPVTPARTARPFKVDASASNTAGLENFTKTLVSSADHRLTLKPPPAVTSRWVTDVLSTPTPTSTGAIDTCVIQLVVMPFQSSPAREPTRASALGIFHVTRFTTLSSSTAIGRA
jgi:hypothetical protein